MNKLGCVVFSTLVGFCEGGLKTTLTYFFTQTHMHETTIGLTEKLSEIRKALSLFAREPYLTAFTGNGISFKKRRLVTRLMVPKERPRKGILGKKH